MLKMNIKLGGCVERYPRDEFSRRKPLTPEFEMMVNERFWSPLPLPIHIRRHHHDDSIDSAVAR